MQKNITIDNKEYSIKSSAFTMFSYQNETGRDLLEDLNLINEKFKSISAKAKEEQSNEWMKELTGILKNILKLTYIMIKESDKDFKPYEDWLHDLDDLFSDTNWIKDVIITGMSPFSRRLQNAE